MRRAPEPGSRQAEMKEKRARDTCRKRAHPATKQSNARHRPCSQVIDRRPFARFLLAPACPDANMGENIPANRFAEKRTKRDKRTARQTPAGHPTPALDHSRTRPPPRNHRPLKGKHETDTIPHQQALHVPSTTYRPQRVTRGHRIGSSAKGAPKTEKRGKREAMNGSVRRRYLQVRPPALRFAGTDRRRPRSNEAINRAHTPPSHTGRWTQIDARRCLWRRLSLEALRPGPHYLYPFAPNGPYLQ